MIRHLDNDIIEEKQLKHKWIKGEKYVYGMRTDICKICGCERNVSKFSIMYHRSGISYYNNAPLCWGSKEIK